MTPQQISLVQTSFARVAPIADQAAAQFYERLFATTPEVEPLFRGDMKVQGAMLMAALKTVVVGLDRVDAIAPIARDLAKRHLAYGVKREHYVAVGAALLWTLERGLGTAFTSDIAAAWGAAYDALSGLMTEAAYPAGQGAA